MRATFPAFGLTTEERRRAKIFDGPALRVLREFGIQARPIWREYWEDDVRRIEFTTRQRTLLTLTTEEVLSLTEVEIVERLRRNLVEGSTLG